MSVQRSETSVPGVLLLGLLLILAGFQAVNGASTAHGVGAGEAGSFVNVTPFSAGSGTLAAEATASYTVIGVGGVPSTGVGSVVVELSATATTTTAASYLTAWASGSTRPGVASLYFTKTTAPRSTTMIVPVGTDGKVSVYNRAGSTTVAVDVVGFFGTSSSATSAGGFVPIHPARVLRSDTGVGMPAGKLALNATRDVQVAGVEGIPATATAIIANVEVRDATAAGALKLGPGGQSLASYPVSVNYMSTGPSNSGIIVKLSTDGKFRVQNTAGGAVNLRVDVQGYITSDPDHGGTFNRLPAALSYASTQSGQTALAAGETRDVTVRGVAGVPDEDSVGAIALTVHVKSWAATGTLTLWSPEEASDPGTTSLSFNSGVGVPAVGVSSSAIVAVSAADGKIRMRNSSSQPVTVILSTHGWFDLAERNSVPVISLTGADIAPASVVGAEYRVYSTTPRIQPKVVDANGESVRVRAKVFNGTTLVHDAWSNYVPSGQRATVNVPSLAGSTAYRVELVAHDGSLQSGVTQFNIRTTTPSGTLPSQTISAPSLSSLVALSTTDRFPSGSTRALVTDPSAATLMEAAAVASTLNAALVLSDDTNLASQLDGLGVQEVFLYGSASSFTATVRQAAQANGRTIAGEALNSASPIRTAAASRWSTRETAFLVSSSADEETKSAAAGAAASAGFPLLVMAPDGANGTPTENSALADLFADQKFEFLTILGSSTGLNLSTIQQAEGAVVKVATVEGSSFEISEDLATQTVASGRSARSVTVAPAGSPAAAGVAGYAASTKSTFVLGSATSDAVSQSDSAAGTWVRGLGPELTQVNVAGVNVPAGYAANLAVFKEARLAAPAIRVTSISAVGGTATQIVLAGLTGSFTLKAYDISGTQLASSSTATIQIPGVEGESVRLVASVGSTVSADLEVRFNSPTEDAAAGSWTSSSGNNHYVSWFDSTQVPRQVRRYVTDPEALDEGDVENAGTVIGVTCTSSFADKTADQTKQYRYEVTSVSAPGGSGCSTSGSSATDGSGTTQGSVEVPPMAYTSGSLMAQTARTMNTEESKYAARPSVVDALSRTSKDNSGQLRAAGPGDDWLPFLIRYQGFIPMNKLPIPGFPPSSILRPVTMLGGDGADRKAHPRSDRYRFRVDTTFRFGSSHGVTVARSHGKSHRYNCNVFLKSCKTAQTATASVDGLQVINRSTSATSGRATVVVDTGVPVLPSWLAPNISARLNYVLSPGKSRISGTHDKMPSHEIWGGPVPGMFYPIHIKGMAGPQCLFAGVPGCKQTVAAKF